MENKRGATVEQIVFVVLALLFVLFVVLMMTGVFDPLNIKSVIYGGGGVNVDDVVMKCGVSCQGNSVYDYCKLKRPIIWIDDNNKKVKGSTTCDKLSNGKVTVNTEEINGPITLDKCPNIDCSTA